MLSPNVARIWEAARALNDEERQELRRLLQPEAEQVPSSAAAQPSGELPQSPRIVVIRAPKRTPEEVARFQAWSPIQMSGGSLADELIRDRR